MYSLRVPFQRSTSGVTAPIQLTSYGVTVDAESYDPLIPVPPERRAFGLTDAFSLWFSLGIGLLVLQTGALLTPGISLPLALAAIVAGSLAGVALLGAAAMAGADTGLSAMAGLRPALGVRGAALPAGLNVLQLVGWGAFELVAMRDAADALASQTFGISSPLAWTLVFGALATAMAMLGPVSFVRRFLRRWGLLLLLGGAGWLTWQLLSTQNLAALWSKPGDGTGSFGAGLDLVIAMPLSWLPLVADYSRFGANPRDMFRGSAGGYLLANIWFYALGAAYALIAPGDHLLVTALAAAGGGIALILVVIDESDNAFADIFSAAMSLGVVVKAKVTRLALFFGVLCTAIALMIPVAAFESFLYLIGSVFAPLFGVLLADHFVLRRRTIDVGAISAKGGAYWFTAGFSWAGLLAWIGGIAAYQLVTATNPSLGATLPGFAAGAGTYLILSVGRWVRAS